MIANKYLTSLDIAKIIIVSIFVLIVFKTWPRRCQSLIPALAKLKGKDRSEFKASLGCVVKCRLILTTEQDAFLKISREINKQLSSLDHRYWVLPSPHHLLEACYTAIVLFLEQAMNRYSYFHFIVTTYRLGSCQSWAHSRWQFGAAMSETHGCSRALAYSTVLAVLPFDCRPKPLFGFVLLIVPKSQWLRSSWVGEPERWVCGVAGQKWKSYLKEAVIQLRGSPKGRLTAH